MEGEENGVRERREWLRGSHRESSCARERNSPSFPPSSFFSPLPLPSPSLHLHSHIHPRAHSFIKLPSLHSENGAADWKDRAQHHHPTETSASVTVGREHVAVVTAETTNASLPTPTHDKSGNGGNSAEDLQKGPAVPSSDPNNVTVTVTADEAGARLIEALRVGLPEGWCVLRV